MEKIFFTWDEQEEPIGFFVLEQTELGGATYLLVADSQEDTAECLILKDVGEKSAEESVYEMVEDDTELMAVSKVFEELLEDVAIDLG